jgi:acetyl esterase/lipase
MVPDPAEHPTVLLWPNGAPGSEGKTDDERHRIVGDRLVVSGVDRPSLTVYLPPKNKSTGAAFIVAPGGSHRELWITHEGYRVADWLSSRGIAAFVLKYRLQGDEGAGYTVQGHALPDMLRAVRLVRSRAAEWNIDPDRVGVIGFSAGSMLAGLAAVRFDDPAPSPADAIDALPARPSFLALIYGSPFAAPGRYQAKVRKDMPPTFLCAGSDDAIAASYPDLFKELKAAGVPVELHLYSGVGHGFGIHGAVPPSVAAWPEQLRDWLFDLGFLSRR